ncbi:UNKNOWN [Stylonychia lemnae]|uniref:Uncharacterized protein n=1 Tax=Stylonychia lemnae TaxID=5949 RepID=A0A078APD5_STYLE|nr:UNKNOWN [Stylonychia lemnae]|eukprot:CDW84230.1 UNKNOWN [Stylonychia lemnae]
MKLQKTQEVEKKNIQVLDDQQRQIALEEQEVHKMRQILQQKKEIEKKKEKLNIQQAEEQKKMQQEQFLSQQKSELNQQINQQQTILSKSLVQEEVKQQITQQTQQQSAMPLAQSGQFYDNRLINKKNVKYLECNINIIEDNKKIKEFYIKLDAWYNSRKSAINMEFKKRYGQDIDGVLQNSLSRLEKLQELEKYQPQYVPGLIKQINQRNADNVMQALSSIQDTSDQKKVAYYRAAHVFFLKIFKLRQTGQKLEVFKSQYHDFYSDIIHNISYQMPQTNIKSILMGKALQYSCLLLPYYPDLKDFQDELDMANAMGYRKADQERENYEETSNRMSNYCRLMFSILVDDAHIERLFQMFVLYLNFRFHQLSSQIIFDLLDFTGYHLLRKYGKVFAEILEGMLCRGDGYCDRYEKYTSDQMINEIQNCEDVVGDEPDKSNTGITIVEIYNKKLRSQCESLIKDFRQKGINNNLPRY